MSKTAEELAADVQAAQLELIRAQTAQAQEQARAAHDARKEKLYRFYYETMQHSFDFVWDYSKTFQPRLFGLLSLFVPLTAGGFYLASEVAKGVREPYLDYGGGIVAVAAFGLFVLWAFGRLFDLLSGGEYTMPEPMSDKKFGGQYEEVLELSKIYGDELAEMVEGNEDENERRRNQYKRAEWAIALVFVSVAVMAVQVVLEGLR